MLRWQHALGDVDLPVRRHPRLGGQRPRRRRDRRSCRARPRSEPGARPSLRASAAAPRCADPATSAPRPGGRGRTGAGSASGAAGDVTDRLGARADAARAVPACASDPPGTSPTASSHPAPTELQAQRLARMGSARAPPAASPRPDRCTRDSHPHTGTTPAAAARATAAPGADRRAARPAPPRPARCHRGRSSDRSPHRPLLARRPVGVVLARRASCPMSRGSIISPTHATVCSALREARAAHR